MSSRPRTRPRPRPRPSRDLPPLPRVEMTRNDGDPNYPVMELPSHLANTMDPAGRSHLKRVPKQAHRQRQSQAVNEMLRDKLAQSTDTIQKIRTLLGTTTRRRSFVTNLMVEMKQLLAKKLQPGILCSRARLNVRETIANLRVAHDHPLHKGQTTHTQTQLEIFVAQHDRLGVQLEEGLQAELVDLGYAVQRSESLLKYGEELLQQLDRLEVQFKDYLKYITYTVQTDRECLKHQRLTKELPAAAQQPVLEVNVEELLPLPQLLELQEWAMQSTRTFHKTARDCVMEESSKAKEMYLATKLCLREMISESSTLKQELQEAVMLLQNQQPMLLKKEKELKEMLVSKMEPLQVCKQRYQIRLQREGTAHVDEVQEALKMEVEQLGETVTRLHGALTATKQQYQICVDKERLLKQYIDVQTDHINTHQSLVGMEDHYYTVAKKLLKAS